MSPLNVHVNRYSVSGKVVYYQYHKGDYLVAWHPKSSTHNERTSLVLKTTNGVEILIRQIAGAVARRIVAYSKVDSVVQQGDQLGFIKFGSRVDLFLPLNTKINVSIDQKVIGNKTIIGYLED
jgi:phosphatidylserine decarboxylase